MSAADKPFSIDKKLVYEAYKAVRANAGATGVERQTIEQFEVELGDNLYKLCNRMSAGSSLHRRCAPSPFRKELAGSGFWGWCVTVTREWPQCHHCAELSSLAPHSCGCLGAA